MPRIIPPTRILSTKGGFCPRKWAFLWIRAAQNGFCPRKWAFLWTRAAQNGFCPRKWAFLWIRAAQNGFCPRKRAFLWIRAAQNGFCPRKRAFLWIRAAALGIGGRKVFLGGLVSQMAHVQSFGLAFADHGRRYINLWSIQIGCSIFFAQCSGVEALSGINPYLI